MTQSATIDLACELIRRPSVTPRDEGCLDLVTDRLEKLGFVCERLPAEDVDNLWAVRGHARPCLVFAGHTDVVPSGPEKDWTSPPFSPTLREGRLYGRGAADMKGSIAAMVVACERFCSAHPDHRGSIGFLLTSDEEGVARYGTRHVANILAKRQQIPEYAIVGEPSSVHKVADTIKVGRRGSLNAQLTVNGIQGHVAYPERADNPIHRALAGLAALVQERWDEGNAYFPATSLQISNMHAGTGANNVIPGTLHVDFNLRFNTLHTAQSLRERVEHILAEHDVRDPINWQLSGEPFLTEQGPLLEATREAIQNLSGQITDCSTSGGTSDGRFLAPLGTQIVELGPVNSSIHKIDEWVDIAELELLTDIYAHILKTVLGS